MSVVKYVKAEEFINDLVSSLAKGMDKTGDKNKKMNELLEECAQKLGIHLQYEIASGRTGTDADKIHFTNEGVPVALVSIPLRYMHSSIETLSLQDVQEIIDLLAQFLCTFDETVNLDPLKE